MVALKRRLVKILESNINEKGDVVIKRLAYAIRVDIDSVLVPALGDLADMGIPRKVIAKIKKEIKKGL